MKKTVDVLIGISVLTACISAGTWVLTRAFDLRAPAPLHVEREIVWVDSRPMLKTCYTSSAHTACEYK